MTDSSELDALRAALVAVEPTGRFVPRRALRRVIRRTRDQTTFRPPAVHDRAWRVDRDRVFAHLLPSELGLTPNEPADLLLLPRPEEPIARQTWVDLWRVLFHVGVDREIDRALASGRLSADALRDLRAGLGPVQWQALRVVLEEENLIDEYDGTERVFREFAALALEVVHFRPADWDAFFPGMRPTDEPLRTLRAVVDSQAIFDRTRPAGLPPEAPGGPDERESPTARQIPAPPPGRLQKWADQGNDLRAAVALQQAGDPSAGTYLDHLAGRLQAVLGLTPEQLHEWHAALGPLLAPSAAGGWPVERRLLYDLQRACLAVERPGYAADLFEWARSLGRRPLKRPLPRTRWVDATRRLRAAGRYAERLPQHTPDEPHALAHLIEEAAHQTEARARAELGPEIAAVLDEVGLVPRDVAERLSRDRLVAELLDRACDRGFLRIGDLRDAIARNRVKLPDLSGPGEFVRGDPLLRADRLLAVRLDGVYRRGEAYLRLFQRGCSVFFGTRAGRWFTRYVALPFGGAFLLIDAAHHMVQAGEGFVRWLTGWGATVDGLSALAGAPAGAAVRLPGPGWVTWPSVLTVGAVLFLLLHWAAFRRQVVGLAKLAFVKVPRGVRHSPLVQALVFNRVTRLFRRYLFVPLGFGAAAGLTAGLFAGDWVSAGLVGGGVAVFCSAFFRTPAGREFEDRVDEAATRLWRLVSVNFMVGILTLILHFFRAVFEAIDRAIYAVDEWLRFREGQGTGVFALKLAVGLVWSVLTYLFRFAWTLLVEPQINPVKHFPVVTVSHKLLLPLVPSLAKQFGVPTETMGTIVFGIPGIFGFLAWEFRENWKLYRANAPDTLRPMAVGSHGQTVRGLLRPGFHSGVVPKTFAKLRKAVRAGNAGWATKRRHALEHIAEAMHRLADRDVAACLAASRRWGGRPVRAAAPTITPHRLLLPFDLGGPEPTVIALEERGGWVIGGVAAPGRLTELGEDARAAFADVLLGLYKVAGVHAVREQVAAVFGPQAYPFDVIPEGLAVPMPDGSDQLFGYDDGPEVIGPDRRLPAGTLVLSERPLAWADWAERWEADAAGKAPREPLIPGWSVLPAV